MIVLRKGENIPQVFCKVAGYCREILLK